MPKDTKPPYFPFYVDDFSSDGKVEAMTAEEVGAYILLLCKAWREEPVGSIPNDDLILARWARLEADRWAACKPKVLAPFRLGTDDRWHQRRMRREHDKLRASKKLRKKIAKNAADKRWHSNGLHASSMPEACQSYDTPSGVSSDSPSPSSSNTPPAPSRAGPQRSPPKRGGVGVSQMPKSKFPKPDCVRWAQAQVARGARIDPHAVGHARWMDGSADDEVGRFLRDEAEGLKPTPAAQSGPRPAQRLSLDDARAYLEAVREMGRDLRAEIGRMALDEGDRERLLSDFCPEPLAAGGG